MDVTDLEIKIGIPFLTRMFNMEEIGEIPLLSQLPLNFASLCLCPFDWLTEQDAQGLESESLHSNTNNYNNREWIMDKWRTFFLHQHMYNSKKPNLHYSVLQIYEACMFNFKFFFLFADYVPYPPLFIPKVVFVDNSFGNDEEFNVSKHLVVGMQGREMEI